MRKLLNILCILILVVTSQAFASARAAEDPSGRMVLCAGNTITVVLTDADGQPVDVPHLCPDATFLALEPLPAPAALAPKTLTLLEPAALQSTMHIVPAPAPGARGPPS